MENVKFYFNKELNVNMIADTFKAAFNQEFDDKYWEWRFLNNPNDKKVYISYIIENGILAAYYAVSPAFIEIENNQYKIALSNMTMTHPDFQGKGYFKKIASALYHELKKDGYIGIYGFANANSHYGFRKNLNWHDLAILNIFSVYPDDFRGFLIKANNYKFTEKDVTKEVFEENTNLITTNSLIKINRNAKNYIWRLYDIPTQSYTSLSIEENKEIKATIIFKFYNKKIDIIEYFYKKNDEAIKNDILVKAVGFLMEKYKQPINLWSNLHSKEHMILEKFGFKETEFNTYFGVIPFVENDLIKNIKIWHYRFYDSDIF